MGNCIVETNTSPSVPHTTYIPQYVLRAPTMPYYPPPPVRYSYETDSSYATRYTSYSMSVLADIDRREGREVFEW